MTVQDGFVSDLFGGHIVGFLMTRLNVSLSDSLQNSKRLKGLLYLSTDILEACE